MACNLAWNYPRVVVEAACDGMVQVNATPTVPQHSQSANAWAHKLQVNSNLAVDIEAALLAHPVLMLICVPDFLAFLGSYQLC